MGNPQKNFPEKISPKIRSSEILSLYLSNNTKTIQMTTMSKLFLLIVITLIVLTGCSEPCPTGHYEFAVGEDVHIKNKTFHNEAVITEQLQSEDCNCYYEVAYFSTLGVRRHRTVTVGEIEASNGVSNTLDEIKELIDKD